MENTPYKEEILNNGDVMLMPKEGEPESTLIFLHGLGDIAHNLTPIFNSFRCSPTPPSIKILLLQAPNSSVTINGGMQMPSWFDILNLTFSDTGYNYNDVIKNKKRIEELIDNEVVNNYNGNYKKVFIGGFSQGCAMALDIALSRENDKKLGGVIGLSGFLFKETVILDENIYNLICHGKDDNMISQSTSFESYKRFKNIKYNLINNMGHNINFDVLNHIRSFFKHLFK